MSSPQTSSRRCERVNDFRFCYWPVFSSLSSYLACHFPLIYYLINFASHTAIWPRASSHNDYRCNSFFIFHTASSCLATSTAPPGHPSFLQSPTWPTQRTRFSSFLVLCHLHHIHRALALANGLPKKYSHHHKSPPFCGLPHSSSSVLFPPRTKLMNSSTDLAPTLNLNDIGTRGASSQMGPHLPVQPTASRAASCTFSFDPPQETFLATLD